MFAVATDHELSTGAAVEVLMKGGNAVDAAIAASVALSVVDPYMSGLGGFGVAIVKRDKVYGLNFVGTAPRELRAELLTREDPWEEYRPSFDGPLSVLVPGSVAGWGELHAKFGTLDWKEVVLPAIRLARGHVVTERIWKFYEGIKGRAGQFHANYETFYKDGRFPLPGETLRQPDLASTLETLADEGWRSFYSGTLAKKTVEAVREQGGLMDDEDLRNYSPVWVDPIEVSHGNYVVYSLPQGTSGPTVLEWLNVVEELDPRGDWRSGEFAHLFLEAGKLALRDDDIWNTGKDYYRVPLDFLLSRQRAKSLAGKVSNEAKFYPKVGRSVYGEHTTSLSVVDDDVSVTITMTQMYGFERNGLLRGLGFNLNDGACYFSLDPADKERVEPGQRPRFPLSPVVAVSEERTVTMGAAGGWTIPQTVTLTLLKSLRFGAAVNDAVNSPRYLMRYRTNSIPYPPGTEVEVEEGIPSDTINYLRARGHVLARHTPLGGGSFGALNGVEVRGGRPVPGADGRRKGSGAVG